MFLGHFALGLAAKRAAPRASLGALFLAAQFIDLLWPTLLLLGIEHVAIAPGITRVTPLDFQHYPVSHSLLAVVGWAAAFAAVALALRASKREAAVLGTLVLSHWLLDLVVHRPDLPFLPWGGAKVGLGLWNSFAASVAVELALFLAGMRLYIRATRPRDRVGSWAWWGLVSFLLLVHAANLFGAPPPTVQAIGWVGQAQWLVVLWGVWVDRHRDARDFHR